MFEIKISGLDESHQIIEKWATKSISLLSPRVADAYSTTEIRHLEIFDDIDFTPTGIFSTWVAPSKENIKNVLNFSKSFVDDDKILIHCQAGISRSTAIAIGVLCQHGMTTIDAVDHITAIRPILWPNNLIIAYCDDLLELEGSLVDTVNQFKSKHGGLTKPLSGPTQENIDRMKAIQDLLKD